VSAGDANDALEATEADMQFSLMQVSDPEIIRQIGPEGILTVLNNTLDNQVIRSQVDITVEVPNFSQAMGMMRANNSMSQAFQQSVFLGGLQ